jgi:hypothetical protein
LGWRDLEDFLAFHLDLPVNSAFLEKTANFHFLIVARTEAEVYRAKSKIQLAKAPIKEITTMKTRVQNRLIQISKRLLCAICLTLVFSPWKYTVVATPWDDLLKYIAATQLALMTNHVSPYDLDHANVEPAEVIVSDGGEVDNYVPRERVGIDMRRAVLIPYAN